MTKGPILFLQNLTLMFFLEKLLDKGAAPRSLHDLSCQFGTKGFSKSVSQIVPFPRNPH
jgi:exonuclease 3'-5' domain-containing protein 1